MTSKIPYSTATEYTGSYRGIYWSARNWSFNGKEPFDEWNYYINIFLNQIKDQKLAKKFWPKDKIYDWGNVADYYSIPVIHDVDFHSGVTFYEKNRGTKRTGRFVKIGCDYSHYHDEGRNYDLRDILYDVQKTIDKFHQSCEYLIRSQKDGAYLPESEGEYTDRGDFYPKKTEETVATQEITPPQEEKN